MNNKPFMIIFGIFLIFFTNIIIGSQHYVSNQVATWLWIASILLIVLVIFAGLIS